MADPISPSLSSSSFYSVPQTFPPESPLSRTPFSDPPILSSTSPSLKRFIKHLPSNTTNDSTSSNSSPMSISPRVRSCDVFIGAPSGRKPSILRFIKWLRAELEMQGISCLVADRSRCRSAYEHNTARLAMDAASFGVVVLGRWSFSSPYSIEEVRLFLARRKLVPIFFELSQVECNARDIIERRAEVWGRYGGRLWELYGGLEGDWREALDGMSRMSLRLEANTSNFRDCIAEAVSVLGAGLGRRRVVERVKSWKCMAAEELPFPRNPNFVGRQEELHDLEMLLFGDIEEDKESKTRRRHGKAEARESEERRRKGKESMVLREAYHEKVERSASMHGKGVACVSGVSGIGKTELLVEYAYMFSQRYKMVLWVGGESRYIHHNYMKLLPVLGIDADVENKLYVDSNAPQALEDIEGAAILMVRKELMRDIPYLLVIDNLEREKDWWDGRNIMELLPPFGGATHILISTSLPQVMNIEPFRLSYLSSIQAMCLMSGSTNYSEIEEADYLRLIEEKVGRLPLTLALVSAILSEFSIKPSKLLYTINNMPYTELSWNKGGDLALKHNPFLVQLLDFVFSTCDHEKSKLAMRILQASSFFAPSAVPLSMLAVVARESFSEHQGKWSSMKYRYMSTCTCMATSNPKGSVDGAFTMLIKLQIAKLTTKMDCISFHDAVKLYAHKRGASEGVADSVFRAISIKAAIGPLSEHMWAACFLLFKFSAEQTVIDLPIYELLSFIEQFVLPLAMHSYSSHFRCNAALELLRVATETLETIEQSFLSEANNDLSNSSCLRISGSRSALQSNPHLYHKFAHFRATLLETRAKILLSGGLYDIGEMLCRTAVSIKEVIYGWEHPATTSSRELLERLIRLQSSF